MKALKLIYKIFLVLLIASSLHAQIPQTISYQGVLTTLDGNPVADGNYYITFKLYDAAQSGTVLWQEAQNVEISKGIFNVILGKVIPLSVAFNKPYWLEILFQGTALAPRIELTASAYSLNSKTVVDSAITSQKIAGGQVVRSINALTDKVTLKAGQNVAISTKKDTVTISATGAVADNDWIISGNNMYSAVSGNVGIGVNSPTDKLSIEGDISARNKLIIKGSTYPTRTLTMESISAQRLSASCDFYINYGTEAGTGGLLFREGAYERMRIHPGGNVGIGISSPSQKLDVSGTVQMTGFKMPTGAANNYVMTSDASGVGTWKQPGTSGWTISGNNMYSAVSGNIGIGTTTPDANVRMTVHGSSAAPAGIVSVAHYGEGDIRPYGVYASCESNNLVSTGGGFNSCIRASKNPKINFLYGGFFGVTADKPVNARGVSVSIDGSYVDADDYALEVSANDPGYAIYTHGTGNSYFNSDVQVNGTLTKSAGSFKIDHPLDPANKYLYHSFVESADMKNIYDGTVVLDQTGEATVVLPDWFEALNKDFRYQLTCIGGYAPVYIAEEISHNQFKIGGGKPGMKVSWQITGIRHDAFAEKHRIPVEEIKPDRERGKYLHPEAFGLSETLGVDYENIKQARENNLRKEE